MRSMPGLICEIRHFVVPQGVAASCSGVFQALTGELAGYLRFKGVIFGRRNIYLHFEGLVAEYQWHGSRMIPVASIMQYLEYRATPTP